MLVQKKTTVQHTPNPAAGQSYEETHSFLEFKGMQCDNARYKRPGKQTVQLKHQGHLKCMHRRQGEQKHSIWQR